MPCYKVMVLSIETNGCWLWKYFELCCNMTIVFLFLFFCPCFFFFFLFLVLFVKLICCWHGWYGLDAGHIRLNESSCVISSPLDLEHESEIDPHGRI